MTELEHIEIEGFKGLEHVEFEPSEINLITGRNNTGKTSFLEAVDLLFNPASLQNFSDNFDSIVNLDYNHCRIRGMTIESEVKTILKRPSVQETERHVSEAILESITYKPGSLNRQENKDVEALENKARTIARRVLEEEITHNSLTDLQDEILVLSTDDKEYPCFLEGDHIESIVIKILKEISTEIGEEEEAVYRSVMNEALGIGVSSGWLGIDLTPENTFLNQLQNTDSAIFIKSSNLAGDIKRSDDEQEPIKIDDIGDYLKEKELVDNIKTFTLDYLVFEDEDGEKEQIPYDFMGDGFKSIVGLLWELIDEKAENNIVLLEEPETHMHPGYIREVVYFLINLAREEDIQLFITTHDSDFINDFFTENLTDEEEAYLEEEFSLLRMEEDSAVVEDYETARENLKDLHLDLRGI